MTTLKLPFLQNIYKFICFKRLESRGGAIFLLSIEYGSYESIRNYTFLQIRPYR